VKKRNLRGIRGKWKRRLFTQYGEVAEDRKEKGDKGNERCSFQEGVEMVGLYPEV